MFNKAVDWKYLDTSPMLKIKLFSEKDNVKQRILSLDEEERLFTSCRDVLRSVVKVALHTGMRRGEILSLEWRNVDLKKREFTLENTKSGRKRNIPINRGLLDELSDLKRRNGHGPLVSTNAATGSEYTDIKKSFRTACRKAKIPGFRFQISSKLFIFN